MSVFFPGRRTGLVRVRRRLELTRGRPLVEVSFRREDLAEVLRTSPREPVVGKLASELFAQLERAAFMLVWHSRGQRELRRQRLVIRGAYAFGPDGRSRLPFKIRVPRPDLAVLAEELWRQVDGGGRRVYTELQLLFDAPVEEWALGRQPRGAHARAWRLLRPVRCALLEAEHLAKIAQADAIVRARVRSALGREFSSTRWRDNALLLVARAFRPAWATYRVKEPDARAEGGARDVYRTLLPPRLRRALVAEYRESAAVLGQEYMARVHEQWAERLLGPEGQAARDFDLI